MAAIGMVLERHRLATAAGELPIYPPPAIEPTANAPLCTNVHPRWTFHFTPTLASWLNAVEGFFAKLTRRRLKRGVFGSLVELQAAINRFLAETNGDPKPFVWTTKPEHILEKVRRGNQALGVAH